MIAAPPATATATAQKTHEVQEGEDKGAAGAVPTGFVDTHDWPTWPTLIGAAAVCVAMAVTCRSSL